MQFKFVTALLLVSVCFSQLSPVHPLLVSEAIHEAQIVIENLENILQATTRDLLKNLEQLKNQVNQQRQEGIDEAKSNLNLTIDDCHQQIDIIKKKAEENGTDISECLVNVNNDLKQVFDKFTKSEIQCVTKEINEALNIINGAIQFINSSSQNATGLAGKLKACGNSLINIVCIKNVITEATHQQITLPAKLTQKVAEATIFVGGLKFRLEFCAATQVAKGAVSATTEIVTGVAKCAANLTQINSGTIGDLIIKAETAIEKFKNTTQEKIQGQLKVLKQLIDNCTLEGQEAIEGAKSKLNFLIAEAQKQIEEIKKKAEANGTDISKCLPHVDASFKQVFDNVLHNEIQCVTKEIDEALNLINGTIHIINKSSKDFPELSIQLQACGSNIQCINEVIVKVTKLAITLPVEIAQKVAQATVFVAGLKFRLELCAATQIVKVASYAITDIVADITKCATSISPIIQENIGNLIKKVETAIAKLRNATQEEIQEHLEVLEQLINNCTSQGQEAIEGAKSKLSQIIAEAKKQIEEIKKKAEANGTDISKCLPHVDASFKQVFDNVLHNEIQCVTKEIDEALNLINGTIQIINKSSKDFPELAAQLQACGSNIQCINEVIVKVTKLGVTLPVEIAHKVVEVTAFVGGLKFRLEQCAAAQIVKGAINAATDIVADVAKCAASIIPINQDNIGNFIIEAEKAIEKLKNTIEEDIQDHLTDLQKLIYNCTMLGKEAIEGAKAKLNQIIADAKEKIEETKNKAIENGTDVSECLVNIDNSFDQVFDNFLKNEIHCVTDEINEALNIINGGIQIIQNASKEFPDLLVELKACGINILCIKEVKLKIIKQKLTLPVEIAQKVAEVTAFVGGLKFRLELCAAAQIVKGAVNATTVIIADFATCAANIIPVNQVNITVLIEETKHTIEKVQNTVQENNQHYLKILQKFKDFCKSQTEEAINEAKSELNFTITNAQKLIEEIKNKAEENGTDISECVVNVTANFKQVTENFLQNEIQCVTKEIDEALNITDDTIQLINDSSKLVADLPKKLTDCGTNLICIKRVIAQVAICENLPVKIARQVLEATVFLGGLKFRLELCAAVQIGKGAVAATSEIITDVTKCAIGVLVKGNKCYIK